jgi:hypothetical protein
MLGRSRMLPASLVAAFSILAGLAACGGGGSSSGSSSSGSGGVVAQVDASPITRSAVNHWMSTLAGGDYYGLSGRQTIPAGLVSEPPSYAACVTRLEVAAARAPHKLYQLSGVQLLRKCRQLYQALRSQATAFLVKVPWLIGLAGELGVNANDAEVLQFYKRSFVTQYPNQAALSSYLTSTRASVADELLLVKLDLLAQKTLQKVKEAGKQGAAKLKQAEASWTAKADCHPGYVVEHCKQFHGEPPPTADSPPASVLMEQVAALVTGRCTNLAACAKP